MKVVNVITEGQSDRRFVDVVLQPHTKQRGVDLRPFVVATGTKRGREFHGGTVKFEVLKSQLEKLLKNQSVLTTTMFDLVKLHRSFFELPGLSASTAGLAVEDLEAAMHRALGCLSHFIPFVMKHEFEALAFSSESILPNRMNANEQQRALFRQVLLEFQNPEEINMGRGQSPSERIQHIWPKFNKVTHGVSVLERIGVDTLRTRCPHFDWWVEQLLERSGF